MTRYVPQDRIQAQEPTGLQIWQATQVYGFDAGLTGNDHADPVQISHANDPASTPSVTKGYNRRGLLKTATDGSYQAVHTYLMGNHYHLRLKTLEPNLVAGMKWRRGAYTQRFNARHRQRGHLSQGRYRAVPVDVEEPEGGMNQG